MPDEVIQATSPVVQTPTSLTKEALTEADARLLEDLGNLSRTPKRRGRPPGSKNKPKEAGIVGAGNPATTPTRRSTRSTDTGAPVIDPSKTLVAKKAKTEEYTKQIVNQVNDQLLMMLVTVGIPPETLYKNKTGPQAQSFRSDLTDAGQRIAINPSMAHAVASFLTELEFTETGTKIAQSVGTGNGAIVLKGLFALGAIFQYLRGIQHIFPMLRAYAEAQAMKAAQEEAAKNGSGQTVRTPGDEFRTVMG